MTLTMRIQLYLVGATMVPLSLALSGCHATANIMNRQTSFVMALLDVSATTKTARTSYLHDLATIMDQLQSGDTLWADQITENSLATSHIPFRLTLPVFNLLSTNADDYNSRLIALKKKASADAESLLNRETKRTTLLDSLLVAQKVFHSSHALTAAHRVLVVFSDMREDSVRYVFDRENLTPARIKQIIGREQTDHRIPDLKGVQVYVAGAAADRSGNPERIRQIEAFWRAYFRAAGTELPDEHYSASLLDFTLPGSVQK